MRGVRGARSVRQPDQVSVTQIWNEDDLSGPRVWLAVRWWERGQVEADLLVKQRKLRRHFEVNELSASVARSLVFSAISLTVCLHCES